MCNTLGRAGIALVPLLLTGAVPFNAGSYLALGAGNNFCGQWLHDRYLNGAENDAAYMEEGWVQGFITGMNVGGERRGDTNLAGIGKDTDPEGMFAWIDNYCRDHPLDGLSDAALKFWDTFAKSSK